MFIQSWTALCFRSSGLTIVKWIKAFTQVVLMDWICLLKSGVTVGALSSQKELKKPGNSAMNVIRAWGNFSMLFSNFKVWGFLKSQWRYRGISSIFSCSGLESYLFLMVTWSTEDGDTPSIWMSMFQKNWWGKWTWLEPHLVKQMLETTP